MTVAASRPVSDLGHDDLVLPFAVEPLDIRGRIVRLGPSIGRILNLHDYPTPIARLVGEAAALAALLGTSLKFDGRLQLQTRTNGALDMLVVDFDAPDRLRAFARFNETRLQDAIAGGRSRPAQILGSGHLALTIDHGVETAQYQGVVPLEGEGFEQAAHRYFQQSEQIPTLVRLAVAEDVTTQGTDWRAGGLLIQFLPESPERQRRADLPPGDAPANAAPATFVEDVAWVEAKALAGTVEDHELIDPALSSERLLYRLFHEHGVKVFVPCSVRAACRCSRERVAGMLRGFSVQDRAEMVGDDGKIGVICEFCSVKREFDPAEFESS